MENYKFSERKPRIFSFFQLRGRIKEHSCESGMPLLKWSHLNFFSLYLITNRLKQNYLLPSLLCPNYVCVLFSKYKYNITLAQVPGVAGWIWKNSNFFRLPMGFLKKIQQIGFSCLTSYGKHIYIYAKSFII